MLPVPFLYTSILAINAHPIDLGIFIAFLIANLVIGLGYGRGSRTLRDYAIGNKDFTTATLTATIVVSWIGGGALLYMLEYLYVDGLHFAIILLGFSLCLLAVSQLTVRMHRFLHNLSVAEAMGDLYGKTVRIITATSGTLSILGVVAIEFQVIGEVIRLLLGIEGSWITVVAALIVVLYSVAGGVRAVTFTDVLQFFVFGTFIPLIALVIWQNLLDPNQVVDMLRTNPNFNLKEVIGWHPKFFKTLAMLIWFAITAFDPVVIQRISMSKGVVHAKRSFQNASMISLLTTLFIVWVAILLLSTNETLEPTKLFAHIIDNYATTGLRGCISVGVMALAMSTADSYLNAASVLLSNDIMKPLRIAYRNEIRVTRLFCLICGLFALLIALYSSGLLAILQFSNSFYMPIVTVPLLVAILGFRTTTRSALIGMGLGLCTVIVWSIFLDNEDSIVPGMLANILGLMGSHYLLREPGGWQPVASDSPLALERLAQKKAWERSIRSIREFKLYPYLQNNLPQEENLYFFLGLYIIAATYSAFYTIGNAEIKIYQPIYTGIYHVVLPIATAFLTFPIWPPTVKSKRFMTFFWPLGIGVVLFFAGALLAIMSHFHHMQIMIMMINLLLTVLLLHWPLAFVLALGGIEAGILFFKYYTGSALPLDHLGSLQFKILYGLLLLASCLIAVFKGKQIYAHLQRKNKTLQRSHQEIAEDLLSALQDQSSFTQACEKYITPTLTRLVTLGREIQKMLQVLKLPDTVYSKVRELNEQLAPVAVQLDRIHYRVANYLRLAVTKIDLNVLQTEWKETLHAKQLIGEVWVKQMTKRDTLQCDVDKIKNMLTNSIILLRNVVGSEPSILINLEDTKLGYARPSVQKDYIKTVQALSFTITTAEKSPLVAPFYLVNQDHAALTGVPKNTLELPLATNKRIIEAHYGHVRTVVNDHTCTLHYIIPFDLREVRASNMDGPAMQLSAELTRANDHYPGAQEKEKLVLQAIARYPHINMSLVHKAIELIKCYHGTQTRKSGEPFYLHPLEVTRIVLDYNQEEATVLGALLHDTVEDTSMLLAHIEMMFNEEVAQIVDSVTHLDSDRSAFYKLKLSAYENTRKLLALTDKRALYVKLADRLHNMRTIKAKHQAHQHKTAEETLLFFVPLATQLNLKAIAEELKERCFTVLNERLA